MSPRKRRRTKFLISYSHQDSAWLERLRVHLKPLERDYGAEIWDDTKIQTGSKWREEIRRALESARVAILLVSADFLGSDFIANDELPPLLKAAEEDGTFILPLILSPSGFKRHEALSEFQAFNDPSKPLVSMSRGEQEAVFEKVAEHVAVLLGSPAMIKQSKIRAGKSGKTKRRQGKRQSKRTKADVARLQEGGNEMNSYEPTREDTPHRGAPNASKERRVGVWLVSAAIGLAIITVCIWIAVKQYDNQTDGDGTLMVKRPDHAQSNTPRPQTGSGQPQSDALRAGLEKGGIAKLFDGNLTIQLDDIRFDKGLSQYVVSCTLSSGSFKEMKLTDIVSSDKTEYTYPADGRFKIKVLSAEENLADFSIEERVN
jgi:hypothetical protein